ncbi:MAG: hypothetical protein SPL70_07815, partial [Cyanobacteriota bacterium]|nr:hypothetical protein [Cyanobacteriota bacterium]
NVTQGMSSFEKGMAIASVGLTVLKALGDLGIIGGAKSQGATTNSSALTTAMDTLGGVGGGTDIQNAISAMETASTVDSATLRDAISSAQGSLDSLKAQSETLQTEAKAATESAVKQAGSELKEAKDASKDAKSKLDTAKSDVNQAKRTRDDAQTRLQGADKDLKENEQNYKSCVRDRSAKENDFNVAHDRHTSATKAKTEAKATLDSTPKTRTEMQGGKPVEVPNEPEYTNAKTAFEKAEAEETAAKKAEDAASKALDTAKKNETEAEKKLGDSEKAKAQAKDLKDKAENEMKTYNNQVKNAEAQVDAKNETEKKAEENEKKAQDNFDKLNNANGKYQANLQKIATLSNAIDKYNKKLSDLEQKEIKKYDDNNKQNTKLKGKYNFADGITSKGESKASATIAANNKENVGLSDLLDKTFASSEFGAHGSGHKTNPKTGNEVYVVNGKQVSKAQYNSSSTRKVDYSE